MNAADIVELGKQFGISVLIFVLFVIEQRSNTKKWERRESGTIQLYESIISQVKESRNNEFDLLKKTLDENHIQLGMLKETLAEIKSLSAISNKAFTDVFTEIRDITKNRCVHKMNDKS